MSRLQKIVQIFIFLSIGAAYAAPIHQYQFIGTHNSYKQKTDANILEVIAEIKPEWYDELNYKHKPLTEQLDLGLRFFELDVFVDQKGGLYSHPFGPKLFELPLVYLGPEMDQAGFKVMHIPDVDFRSSAASLKNALDELKKFSDANPKHDPIFILLELKEEGVPDPFHLGFTVPEKWEENQLIELENLISNTLGRVNILTPGKVQGEFESLKLAILNRGWPNKEDLLGKFVFLLDNTYDDVILQRYLALEGFKDQRILFVSVQEEHSQAGFMKINEITKENFEQVKQLIKKNFLIRTRSDAGTIEARINDYSRFQIAKDSGAQLISTDFAYPNPDISEDFKIQFDSPSIYIRPRPL